MRSHGPSRQQVSPGIVLAFGILSIIGGVVFLIAGGFVGAQIPQGPLGFKEGILNFSGEVGITLIFLGLFSSIAGGLWMFSDHGRRGRRGRA